MPYRGTILYPRVVNACKAKPYFPTDGWYVEMDIPSATGNKTYNVFGPFKSEKDALRSMATRILKNS